MNRINHKISIISINFNNRQGLLKTIESVCSQTFSDFDYIVIDGGSTDGSLDVIKQYAHKIDYWVSEPDKGIYNAMNKGIARANGDYLLFLNSGDWLTDRDILERISVELSGCDILYGNMVKAMPDGTVINDKGIQGAEITFKTLYQKTINHSSAFIKRSMFSLYGLYDESLSIVSDWKFFLIAAGLNKSKIVYFDVNVTYFDMTGISNFKKDVLRSEKEKVLKELVPFPILADYKNSDEDNIRLDIIRKHLITAKLYRFLQILLVRFSKMLDRLLP